MKKAILLTIGLISISAICFAEDKAAPKQETVKSTQEQPVVVKEKEPVPVKPAAKEEKAVSVKDVIKEDKVVPVKEVVKEKADPAKAKSGTFSGKVQLVGFMVMSNDGQSMGFQAEPGSSVVKVLSDIKKDSKVKVDYEIKPSGPITAVSIKLE